MKNHGYYLEFQLNFSQIFNLPALNVGLIYHSKVRKVLRYALVSIGKPCNKLSIYNHSKMTVTFKHSNVIILVPNTWAYPV